MSGTVLKRFQQDAISNGRSVLQTCLTELEKARGTKDFANSKRMIVSDVGALLFEAPTGTGKTLMAGHVVEEISRLHQVSALPKVIWFWFAPFSGLIEQARRTIRAEFMSLRPKNPTTDRDIGDLKSGDVFVTTWASVAVANEVSRKSRTDTEVMPSIDNLVSYARSLGFSIGVVIDEAHHSFKGQSQAFAFYRNVLAPELTILVTATPKDKDIDAFTKVTGIKNLRRITVSRQQAIEDRLIKDGVKVAVFKAPTELQSLIDFKMTALKQAVATHNRLKQAINDAGLTVTPLLLVQVDSEDGSVEQATQWLKALGFRTEGESGLIRSHTASEPDPYLSTIAADESVEVLIFKLAVATGFDAPRAFTLVSFRVARDEDFGVQIVGRILRVDRRLQVAKGLPLALNYGYVFLSHRSGQTGLTSAAQRINSVTTELASITTNVAVVAIGAEEPSAQMTQHGQTSLLEPAQANLDTSIAGAESPELATAGISSKTANAVQDELFEDWGLTAPASVGGAAAGGAKVPAVGLFNYPLRTQLGAPHAFRRALLSLESNDIIRDIVSRFRFDDDVLLVAQQSATTIVMEEVEIFGNRKDRLEEIRADLAQDEIDSRAQQALFKADDYDVIDIRDLHKALLSQLKKEFERKGLDTFDSEAKLRAGLHKILALRPLQLKRAISEAVAQHTESEQAADLPKMTQSASALQPSRLNLYGIFPDDLNTWERPFAELLDDDLSGTVKWWHRNPPRKPYSVSMPLPGQPDFYPDFVVGIRDRKRGGGILLMETKRVINDQERNALVKAQAEHPDYAKVMMIYWEDKRAWKIVEYDSVKDCNFLDRVLREELMISY
ncbi:DEAD/DEAH box helicase family protein [Pseudomonas syringae]|nr:DEAD/DEAH box helicase family protein [Pseudomonas syringae]